MFVHIDFLQTYMSDTEDSSTSSSKSIGKTVWTRCLKEYLARLYFIF